MANGDLMDLQEVISALGISEQDLQNMVAQGKIKAVRAGRTIKFRRDEVMGMKGGRSTEPTIIIPAQEPEEAPLVDESAATVVPEEPAGGVVPVDTQEISLEDEELEIVPLEDEAAATVAETSPVPGEDSGYEELTVVEEVEEEVGAAAARRPSSRSSRARMSRRMSQAAYAEPEASPLWAGALIFTALVLLFVGSVFGVILMKGYYDVEKGKAYVPAYLEWVVDKFKGQ